LISGLPPSISQAAYQLIHAGLIGPTNGLNWDPYTSRPPRNTDRPQGRRALTEGAARAFSRSARCTSLRLVGKMLVLSRKRDALAESSLGRDASDRSGVSDSRRSRPERRPYRPQLVATTNPVALLAG
jgi:hypothetical protein